MPEAVQEQAAPEEGRDPDRGEGRQSEEDQHVRRFKVVVEVRTLLFLFIVRVVKRPRGAPGPRKQLSVRFELSVRVVPPDPKTIKRPFDKNLVFFKSLMFFKGSVKKCDFSIIFLSVREVPQTPKIIKRPFRIKRPRGAPGPRKQLSVRGR